MTRMQGLKVSLRTLAADALVAPVWVSLRLTGHATCSSDLLSFFASRIALLCCIAHTGRVPTLLAS